MSPAILIFIIAVLAMSASLQNVSALTEVVFNHKIPPAGASVTYTFQNQRTGKSYTVLYFVATEMGKVKIELPADFKEGDIINGTMVEDFPYNLTQSSGFGPPGDAGGETSFDLTPENVSKIQQGSRAI